MQLTEDLKNLYLNTQPQIQEKLKEFSEIAQNLYFYELCFCICTPQSKAANALIVQKQLMKENFLLNDIDVTSILGNPTNYIRFHNQKSHYLIKLKDNWEFIFEMIKSSLNNYEKRDILAKHIVGIGLKESSHFLRNIGYRGLAILDRHILRTLAKCQVFETVPVISNENNYHYIEQKFLEFADYVHIPIDELDLLFWSSFTGNIIK